MTSAAGAQAVARRFVRAFASATRPALFECDDGCSYVVKAPRSDGHKWVGRGMAAEHVVGELGASLRCRVPVVGVVGLPEHVLRAQPETATMAPGLAHGSRFVPGLVVGQVPPAERTTPDLLRVGLLARWVGAVDYELLRQEPGGAVWALDFGESLGGPEASPEAIRDAGRKALVASPEDLPALPALAAVSQSAITAAVLSVPLAWWGFSPDAVRSAVLAYLVDRRTRLLAS